MSQMPDDDLSAGVLYLLFALEVEKRKANCKCKASSKLNRRIHEFLELMEHDIFLPLLVDPTTSKLLHSAFFMWILRNQKPIQNALPFMDRRKPLRFRLAGTICQARLDLKIDEEDIVTW